MGSEMCIRDRIYTALKTNGNNVKDFKIQQVIPRELIPIKKSFDKIAKAIRNKLNGTKTRVLCNRGEISLSTRSLNNSTYTKITQKELDETVKSMVNSLEDQDLEYLGYKPNKRKRETNNLPTNQAKKTK